MTRSDQTTKKRRTAAKLPPREKRPFTLEVTIVGGPITRSFMRQNPVISRTIEARGDHTLAELHEAIFNAFDRYDEHLYEFQVGGKQPMDRQARRYCHPMAMDDPFGEKEANAARTTLDSLGLAIGDVFYYWFDFGDDWWHRIEVRAIAEGAPLGKLPRVTQRIGESPPQYVDMDEE